MDKDTRNAIERATQRARKLLEDDFASQLEGTFDVLRSGTVVPKAGSHLTPKQVAQRDKIVAAIEHKRAAGMGAADAVADYLRDVAFTTLNRFVALKMLEARDLVQECITKGEQSAGYRELCGFAPGVALLPESTGYRLYIESLFDELSTEVKVLFDRRDPSSVLWPKRATFGQLLEILNASELARVWGEDETIGWVYQFFNGQDERKKMREESQAPRNSRELAVRNQFFTPRYVVQFLTDNTLGRIWYEMRGTKTALAECCEYMVRKPDEELAPRTKKDPRDLRVLDPACGSGHFLLYAFDLLLVIYEEARADPESPKSEATGKTLAEDYPSLDALRKAIPGLVLAHNLHGVDIDPRCAQIAQLALWMRAQKAYRDLGVGRADRAQIRRSNIVVAEPLVADEQISKEFVAKLGDADLGRVFTSLVDSLSLAGNMGLLLRVEQLVKSPARKQGELFAPPEERIHEALDRFVREEASATSAQRWLFAEDASQAFALLGLAEKRFDAVVMNPPFGSPSESVAEQLDKKDCGNLYSAFVRRAVELGGSVGCISDRTFLTQASFKPFRLELLRGDVRLRHLADLGWGVLDANVQTVAYVLERDVESATCINCKEVQEKARRLLSNDRWVAVDHESFLQLPDSVLAFELPGSVLQRVSEWRSLNDIANLPRGLGSNKAERTYLAWFEVPLTQGSPRRWEPLANGGDFSPWWRDDLGVGDWRTPQGVPWVAMGSNESSRPYDQGPSPDYFKAGLSFPKQSAMFNVAVLPKGFLPTREGKAIIPYAEDDCWWLLSYLNSGPVRSFVRDTCGLHKQSGAIGRIPVPEPDPESRTELARASQYLVNLHLRRGEGDETSHYFVTPHAIRDESNDLDEVVTHLQVVETAVRRLIGLRESDKAWIEPAVVPTPHQQSETAMLSWLVGLVFGRFRPVAESGNRTPFAAIDVTRSPGMYPEGEEPADRRDILVDDEGHADDLAARARAVAERVKVDVPDNLRRWLAKEFFPLHIKMYSKSRRKAPIYWQFATPSASYSVWLYIHAFSRDTLFRVQNDYAAPKLAHEERRLESLASELRDGATATQRKELAAQENVVEELRAFLEEVTRVAPLWNPNLDDGVIINFAPLWRLVPHFKPWQKELKATWDSLCEGKYDWAHLAMHLWPERVVPRCAADRSLAIAHGLEDVFWVEGSDGKWTPRKAPTRPVGELVGERTSPAVKAALKNLLEAPAAIGSAKKTKKGKANA
jgi:hypothetical protein